MHRAISLTCIACILSLPFSTPSFANMASGWWGGDWDCIIDGRPARMRWSVVDNGSQSCEETDEGTICSSSVSAGWKGRFSDNGSKWVSLTNAKSGDKGGLFFTHADGNRWYLAKPVGRTAKGWTTWNGQRYPLSCTR
ncbi:DUF6006 family protein [Paracoccus sp. MBLB3053]|uniref:DUF6006 family protein n=1 Tax=Paracoccus aurantius TaxID=3073814 RepID=A0ABU2HQJ2_9RHOB|nr:DUF6006 family protein [Paracoccus sp. MBLB3053]MDS9467311.1 DUF6006 family protein [Paracoccus sp. MBLB3053]